MTTRRFRLALDTQFVERDGRLTRDGFRMVQELFDGALASHTVAGVPSAAKAGPGAMIYVTDEAGGGVPAFSDGANWRRVTDRAVIS